MQRQTALHELGIMRQTHHVIGENLNRRHRADTARVERRGMNVASFHHTKHLARVTADLQRLAVEFAFERIQRVHDVRDGPITVVLCVGRLCFLGLLPDSRIRFLHHHLAELDADEIVLENVVIEHVLGCFTEIHDPFTKRRWLYSVGHLLCITGAGGVIVTADAADPARNEMGVARIFVLHEDAVAAENRRSAITFDYLFSVEVNFCENAETADDPSNRIPIHLDDVPLRCGCPSLRCGDYFRHKYLLLVATLSVKFRFVSSGQFSARMTPLRLFVDGAICDRAQSPKNASPHTNHDSRKRRSRWGIHEWHELIRETRHGAADANSADVRATANAVHPPALGYVAVNDRTPTANFYQAFG